jgi:hypothetical protein
MTYVEPRWGAGAFTCPHCEVFSRHRSSGPSVPGEADDGYGQTICDHCHRFAIWVGKVEEPMYSSFVAEEGPVMVFPPSRAGPEPNADLPDEALAIYDEARRVFPVSPRSAAALLRLALDHVTRFLGAPEDHDLNKAIGWLVEERGVHEKVQKACDAVRVSGNAAVHPGQIDFDEAATVDELFRLINVIADDQITTPKEIDDIYSRIPESKRRAIEERDNPPQHA